MDDDMEVLAWHSPFMLVVGFGGYLAGIEGELPDGVAQLCWEAGKGVECGQVLYGGGATGQEDGRRLVEDRRGKQSLHTYVEIVGSKPESWLPAELVRDVMPVPSWLPISSTQLSPTRLYPGPVVALGTNSREANAGPSNRTRPANSPHQAQRGQVVGLEAANEGLVCPHPLMAPSAVSSIAASNAFPQLGSLRDCQPWVAIGFVVKPT